MFVTMICLHDCTQDDPPWFWRVTHGAIPQPSLYPGQELIDSLLGYWDHTHAKIDGQSSMGLASFLREG